MLPFENFVHCEKELWVHWGERWHNWFNIKFSFFRWNFFMVWWMDQQFLGMWLDSNHHHDRHKKCRRVNRHLDATVSLYSLAIRLCDVHNKVDRKRRSSKLWNRRANNKKDPWYAFATNESKGCPVIWNFLSTFYEVFDCRKLTHKTLWLKITIKLYERSEPWIHIFFRRENCYFWSFNHQNWRRHHKRLTQHSSTLRDF